MQKIRHKRGDTLSMEAVAWLDDDQTVPRDLTGVTIRSAAQFNTFRHDFTVTIVDAAQGQFVVSATAAEMATFPAARIAVDIEFTVAGQVSSTETFYLSIIEDVT